MSHPLPTPWWTWVAPLAGIVLVAGAALAGIDASLSGSSAGVAVAIAMVPLLIAAVFAAVHHAEDSAHITGEPLGTLVLTIAVTIIELALIISIMASGKASPTLVRDTVFAVVMIVTTGLAGLCILIGGLRYREQVFDVTSAKIYLAVLIVLVSLTLVLPNYTKSAPGQLFSSSQLTFVSVATIALYGVYLFTQTVRHREYFVGARARASLATASRVGLSLSIGLLCLALAAVVLLAKLAGTIIGTAVEAAGVPNGVTGVIIALIVLTPESIAAVKAAKQDDLQKSINLTLGSCLATIGLTVPAMAAANIVLGQTLVLGLDARDMTLLITTLMASILTFGTGRTNVLFGFLHLVLFGTFLFLTFVP